MIAAFVAGGGSAPDPGRGQDGRGSLLSWPLLRGRRRGSAWPGGRRGGPAAGAAGGRRGG